MEQEQYYIATEDGKTEGPYYFESLETFYTHGKIRIDTLVCITGGQEWVKFRTVLEHERKTQASQRGEATHKIQEQQDTRPSEPEPLGITVEGLFRLAGILALFAGVVLLFSTAKDRQPVLGFIYLLSGAFSCLGCFWCAKVIKLLSRAVDLLSVIAKRAYNSGTSTNKQ